MPDLNIEGTFVQGGGLCLPQRGNSASAINARIAYSWHELQPWLAEVCTAPKPAEITRFELDAIDGVTLSFTDGAALPGADWLFSVAGKGQPGHLQRQQVR